MTFALRPVHILDLRLGACRLAWGGAPCTAGTPILTGTVPGGAVPGLRTITLDVSASGESDAYKGRWIAEDGGRGALCVGYDGASKVATVDRDWPLNELWYSDALDQAPWSELSNLQGDYQNYRDPAGTFTASRLAGVQAGSQLRQSYGGLASAVYAYGVFWRQVSSGRTRHGCWSPTTGWQGYLEVDWTPDGVPAINVGLSFQIADAFVQHIHDGWYWIGATFPQKAATTDALFFLMPDRLAEGKAMDVWRPTLSRTDQITPAAKTLGAALGLPGPGTAYRILDPQGACYNTVATCQDRPNYDQVERPYAFVGEGTAPPLGETLLPLVTGANRAATVVDLEQGLGRRGTVSVTLKDEAAGDQVMDPYAAGRAAAGGSFWARLLARNPNYGGRRGLFKWAYLDDAWSWPAFTSEEYQIEEIDGPDSNGRVTVTLKDPLKLTDRREVPAPSNGKLLAELAADALLLTLEPGQGAGYPAAGYVRLGREVIQYDDNTDDVLSWPALVFRGTWGTAADSHEAGDQVQLCRTWIDVPATTVLQDLLTESGLPAVNIDSAGFAAEEQTWLGPLFNVTANISAPTKANRSLADLVKLLGGYMWYAPAANAVRFRVFAPPGPGEIVRDVTDAGEVIDGSVRIRSLDKLRQTWITLYYAVESAVANRREASSFLRAVIRVDAAAESADEYGDRRMETWYSRWWQAANDLSAQTVVGRALAYYRDAPRNFDLAVSAKDAAIQAGDIVDVTLQQLTAGDGSPLALRGLVLQRQDRAGRIQLTVRETEFAGRFGFIGPDGIGDYPADPEYAHIAADQTGFSDGSSPYLIY